MFTRTIVRCWSTLAQLRHLLLSGDYKGATDDYQRHLTYPDSSSSPSAAISMTPPIGAPNFFSLYPKDTDDIALLLMRAFAAQGRLDGARGLFQHCVRDLTFRSSVIVDAYLEAMTRRSNFSRDDVAYVLSFLKRRPANDRKNINSNSNINHSDKEASSDNYAPAAVAPSQLTYLYLIELHLRMEKDPSALWWEMLSDARGPDPMCPLGNCLEAAQHSTRSVTTPAPPSPYGGSHFSSSPVNIAHNKGIMADYFDEENYQALIRQKTQARPRGADGSEAAYPPAPEATEYTVNTTHTATMPLYAASGLLFHSLLPKTRDASLAFSVASTALASGRIEARSIAALFSHWAVEPDVPPELALWLIFQLELRCVLERQGLLRLLKKGALVNLLLRCARAADVYVTERLVALMERHLVAKTADILSLLVWAYAAAGEVEKAFDTLETMARKGFLVGADPFRRYVIETIGYTMDRHYLMALAEALSSKLLVDRAYYHLEGRHARGLSVTAHSLDVIVLACSLIGDETRATETLDSYLALGVTPRTSSYNCLLLACSGRRATSQHRTVFEAMRRAGVAPNSLTFKLLIRQAVLNDDVREAIAFLELVPQLGARVEVEFILPILERAARAGDIDTAQRLCQHALDSDIGIDPAVLANVVKALREHGADTSAIQEMVPAHERLRSRSKAARRRVLPTVPAA